MPNLAILDDYTNAALTSTDWDILPDGYKITVFNDNLVETGALAKRLANFDIVCVMRERTPFPSCLLYTSPSPRDATLSRMPSSA